MVWFVLGVYLAFAVVAALMPGDALGLLAKEGPVEQLSHGLLVLAIAAWGRAALRRRDRQRWFATAITVWCGLVLLEELDWGAVYGWVLVSDWMFAGASHPNLHNAGGGASYVVFGLPLGGLYGPGWLGRESPLGVPSKHAAGAAVVVAVALAAPLLGEGEAAADELCEAMLYGVLLGTAWASGLSTRV